MFPDLLMSTGGRTSDRHSEAKMHVS